MVLLTEADAEDVAAGRPAMPGAPMAGAADADELVPLIKPRRVSASLVASALRKYTTWILPLAAVGISMPATNALMRVTSAGVSARISKLLVRGSTAIASLASVPGLAGFGLTSGIRRASRAATSTALAYCSLITCTSVLAGMSIEAMMRAMRLTFSA